MNEIKKLEVDRLIKELEFLNSDLNYKSAMLKQVDDIFIQNVDRFLDNHPHLKQVYEEKIATSINDTHQELEDVTQLSEDSEDFIEESIEPKVKKLYRSIVKTIHPDKIQDSTLREVLIDATHAYDSNNLVGIFAVCEKLKIPYDVSEEEMDLMQDEVKKVKGRIKFLESTITWKWFSQKDNQEKDQIILSYIKSRMLLA